MKLNYTCVVRNWRKWISLVNLIPSLLLNDVGKMDSKYSCVSRIVRGVGICLSV